MEKMLEGTQVDQEIERSRKRKIEDQDEEPGPSTKSYKLPVPHDDPSAVDIESWDFCDTANTSATSEAIYNRIRKLALDYQQRAAANVEDWVLCVQAHGLANACLKLHHSEENQKLVYSIERTWYKDEHSLNPDDRLQKWLQKTCKRKSLLEAYRVDTKREFDSLLETIMNIEVDDILNVKNLAQANELSDTVFKLSKECSDRFVNISKGIIESSIEDLGYKTNCPFAVIGLGSVARGEATPYSDLEYAFVIGSHDDDDYFEKLAVESYFQIGNVGETPLKCFHIKELEADDSKQPSTGYRIDGITPDSGNIPTGNGIRNRNGEIQKLTLTVDELEDLYVDSMSKPLGKLAGDLADLLSSSIMIYCNEGGQKLYVDLRDKVNRILQTNKRSAKMIDKRLSTIVKDIKDYDFLPEFRSFGPPDNANIKIKSDIFRYPTLLANHLRLALALVDSYYAWDTHYSLKRMHIITDTVCSCLNLVLALSIYTRTSAYMSVGSKSERLTLYTSSVDTSRNPYCMPKNVFVVIGCLLAPIKNCIQSSIGKLSSAMGDSDAVIRSLLGSIQISEPDVMLKAEVLFFAGDPDGALRCLYKVISEDQLNKGANELIELISKKRNVKYLKHFLEFYSYLLCSARKYEYALHYLDWLKEYESITPRILSLQIASADCLNKVHKCIEAKSLLKEAIKTLRTDLTLQSDRHLLDFVCGLQQCGNSLTDHVKSYCEASAHAYQVICDTYQSLRFHVQALPLMKLLICKKLAVKCSTAIMFDSIGCIYTELGDYKSSFNNFTTAFKNITDVHGECSNHPDMVTLYGNRALLHQKHGEYQKALECLKKALSIIEVLHQEDNDHLDIASVYSKIGDMYYEMTDYNSSLENYENSMKILNAQNAYMLSTYRGIGNVYSKLKDYTKALQYLQIAKEIITTPGNPCNAIIIRDIANVYTDMGENDAALLLHENALAMLKDIYSKVDVEQVTTCTTGTDHPDIADCYSCIGNVYCNKGQFTKAIEYHKIALRVRKAVYGENGKHPDIAKTYNSIGGVYEDMDEGNEALQYYESALAMLKNIYGEDTNHPDLASIHNNIGSVHHSLENYDAALENHKLSLKMKQASYLGQHHLHIAYSYYNIGSVYDFKDNHADAIQYYSLAVDLMETCPGKSVNQLASIYNNISSVYRSMENTSEAERYLEKARETMASS